MKDSSNSFSSVFSSSEEVDTETSAEGNFTSGTVVMVSRLFLMILTNLLTPFVFSVFWN